MMWNPFKRKHLVPIEDCVDVIIDAIQKHRDTSMDYDFGLWEFVESKGVQRKWSWYTHKNYLVFNSKEDYTLFLLKL